MNQGPIEYFFTTEHSQEWNGLSTVGCITPLSEINNGLTGLEQGFASCIIDCLRHVFLNTRQSLQPGNGRSVGIHAST